jgi:hypothetical protein
LAVAEWWETASVLVWEWEWGSEWVSELGSELEWE